MADPRDSFLYRAALRVALRWGSPGKAGAWIALALPVVAVLPLLGLTAVPVALPLLGARHLDLAVVAMLTVMPALVAIAVATRGLQAICACLDGPENRVGRQAVLRILVAAALFLYAVALAALMPAASGVALCLAVAALALACGWLFLLQLILAPVRAARRRYLAAALDAALLSGFLYAGGGGTAAWWPAYVYLAIDNGLRFGAAALAVAVGSAIAGFAAVAATTAFWRQQPLLSGGLIAALLMLPAYLAPVIRRIARDERQSREKSRMLAALAEQLRAPAETVARALERVPGDAAARRMAGMLLSRLDDLRDLAETDSADLTLAVESFDLRRTVNDATAKVRAQAAEKRIGLLLRVDPQLPYRLYGRPRQFGRLLSSLISEAVAASEAGEVRVAIEQAARDGASVRVATAIRSAGAAGPEGAEEAVLARLAAAMGGWLTRRAAPGDGSLVVFELPFAIDRSIVAEAPDLRHRPVFLVTRDAAFAEALGRTLTAWRADPCAIGAPEDALEHLRRRATGAAAAILIVDGRGEPLPALSFVHRATAAGFASPASILLVAEPPQAASLAGLAEREVAAVLPAPVADALLASALRALPEPDPTAEPIAAPPPPRGAETRAIPVAAAKRRLRVLVADDDAASRKIIERVLDMAGHMVALAATGREALAALADATVDVALIDLNLPELSGYEAVRRHRAAYPGPPILGLTADSANEVEGACRAAGMDGVLQKPIEPSRLVAVVEAAAEEAKGEPPAVVTRIAVHPRFAAENAAIVDEETVDALRALAAGSDFFRDVVDAFRRDAREILQRIGEAAATGDTPRFKEAVHALRSCAANVGGRRLCEFLSAMHEASGRELRREGGQLVQRLGAEFARLDTVLLEYCEGGEATRY